METDLADDDGITVSIAETSLLLLVLLLELFPKVGGMDRRALLAATIAQLKKQPISGITRDRDKVDGRWRDEANDAGEVTLMSRTSGSVKNNDNERLSFQC